MKSKKIMNKIVIVTSFAFIFGVFTVNAIDGYMGYAGISLPAFQGQADGANNVKKTTNTDQHYENTGTINAVSGARESVKVAVKCESNNDCFGLQSLWTTIADRALSKIEDDNHITATGFIGDYSIHFKRANWGPTKASHSGSWYLDEKWLP